MGYVGCIAGICRAETTGTGNGSLNLNYTDIISQSGQLRSRVVYCDFKESYCGLFLSPQTILIRIWNIHWRVVLNFGIRDQTSSEMPANIPSSMRTGFD